VAEIFCSKRPFRDGREAKILPIVRRTEKRQQLRPHGHQKALKLSCRRGGRRMALETQRFLFAVIPENPRMLFPPPGLDQQSKVSSDAPEEMGIPSDA
jgi:hypothetical protein